MKGDENIEKYAGASKGFKKVKSFAFDEYRLYLIPVGKGSHSTAVITSMVARWGASVQIQISNHQSCRIIH